VVLARGRDTLAYYGGEDVVDVGFYFWNMTFTPGFTQWPPRSVSGYLAADF